MRSFREWAVSGAIALIVVACGGGSSGGSGGTTNPTGSNVAPLSVNIDSMYVNALVTSVTVCAPGTTTCQTIDNVLVDTGSYGFRVLNSVLATSLQSGIPLQTNSSGSEIAECAAFADGFSWGPVGVVDLSIGGEKASSLPIQIIGSSGESNTDSTFPPPPSSCTSQGVDESNAAALGVNGIIGVGNFPQDCGGACADSNPPDIYYACVTSTQACSVTSESLANQLQNPVSKFAVDNNGLIIELPSISTAGAVSVSGSMVFGIGTQSNNSLGSAKILTLDNSGEFQTAFNGSNLTSFVDTGSNALYFASSITVCSGSDAGFYCPSSTQSLSAVMTGTNSTAVTVPFSVANTDTLSNNDAAFNDLAGNATGQLAGFFDWGLPFYYGRNVYFAIDGAETPGGAGPYFAF